MKIINGCNFDGDYPNEKFVEGLPYISEPTAHRICNIINEVLGEFGPRWYRVVPDDYVLVGGFEP